MSGLANFKSASNAESVKSQFSFFEELPKMQAISPLWIAASLLVASNVFMTYAWYGHLKNFAASPWYIAALASWGIAFFEYMLQVPANRIGFSTLSLAQLKVMQEVITLAVFVPFAVLQMGQEIKMDYLYAAFCLAGAVYFIFRN